MRTTTRFASNVANFSVLLVPSKKRQIDGEIEYVRDYDLEAQFRQTGKEGFLPHEVIAVEQRWMKTDGIRGLAEQEDPWRRISLFVLEDEAKLSGWSEQEVDLARRKLMALAERESRWIIYLEPLPVEAPSNKYDLLSIEEIVALARLSDDYDKIIQYEMENLNRSEVIAAVELARTPALDDVEKAVVEEQVDQVEAAKQLFGTQV